MQESFCSECPTHSFRLWQYLEVCCLATQGHGWLQASVCVICMFVCVSIYSFNQVLFFSPELFFHILAIKFYLVIRVHSSVPSLTSLLCDRLATAGFTTNKLAIAKGLCQSLLGYVGHPTTPWAEWCIGTISQHIPLQGEGPSQASYRASNLIGASP